MPEIKKKKRTKKISALENEYSKVLTKLQEIKLVNSSTVSDEITSVNSSTVSDETPCKITIDTCLKTLEKFYATPDVDYMLTRENQIIVKTTKALNILAHIQNNEDPIVEIAKSKGVKELTVSNLPIVAIEPEAYHGFYALEKLTLKNLPLSEISKIGNIRISKPITLTLENLSDCLHIEDDAFSNVQKLEILGKWAGESIIIKNQPRLKEIELDPETGKSVEINNCKNLTHLTVNENATQLSLEQLPKLTDLQGNKTVSLELGYNINANLAAKIFDDESDRINEMTDTDKIKYFSKIGSLLATIGTNIRMSSSACDYIAYIKKRHKLLSNLSESVKVCSQCPLNIQSDNLLENTQVKKLLKNDEQEYKNVMGRITKSKKRANIGSPKNKNNNQSTVTPISKKAIKKKTLKYNTKSPNSIQLIQEDVQQKHKKSNDKPSIVVKNYKCKLPESMNTPNEAPSQKYIALCGQQKKANMLKKKSAKRSSTKH